MTTSRAGLLALAGMMPVTLLCGLLLVREQGIEVESTRSRLAAVMELQSSIVRVELNETAELADRLLLDPRFRTRAARVRGGGPW